MKFFSILTSLILPLGLVLGSPPTETYRVTNSGISLQWGVFVPADSGPHPAVLVIHPGGFRLGTIGPASVCRDLANSGFFVLAVEYRLAPPHTPLNYPKHIFPGQNTVNDNGWYPEQTDDIQAAIRAARVDPRSNGKVYCVGGSAGGSHAVYMAATGQTGDDMPDLVVSLSGVYKLDDVDHLAVDYPPGETNFHDAVMNYIHRTDHWPNYSQDDLNALHIASPVSYFTPAIPPIFFLVSSDDAGGVDTFQFPDLKNALDGIGFVESSSPVPVPGAYKDGIVPVSVQTHAFEYWNLPVVTGETATVRDVVIQWLKG